MNDATRRRLFNLGLMASYVVLPYSVTCMVIGGIYYRLFEKEEDHSGDGFLSLVLGAPVTLPVLVYAKLRERFIDDPAFRTREALHRRIGNALVTALHAEGIPLTDSAFDFLSIRVTAEALDERQRFRFGEAVARTIERFPDVHLATICGCLSPIEALDEAWARRHGFADWATDVGANCEVCGRRIHPLWVFGRAVAAEIQKRRDEALGASHDKMRATNATDPGAYREAPCQGCLDNVTGGKPDPSQDT